MSKTINKEITNRQDDFAKWYTDIVLKCELADYGPVKGTMVIRPYGYEIWENIQKYLDGEFKKLGHKNAYFPLFIPESFMKKEAEHVEGFAPELAIVSHVGDEKLDERLVVRPTSETIICHMFAKWLNSYKDLPVLINQWCNIVRMEKTTRPFLRTTEFLWQEGHTLHLNEDEARKHTLTMLQVYIDFCRDVLAIEPIFGQKTPTEKFAGAVDTYSFEIMTQDGKALQAGTSHYLGTNFAKAFDIKFLDSDGTHKMPHQTSWGVTTRLIGALIMAHGDDSGLALPPYVAPIQARIIPVASHKEGVKEKCLEILAQLQKAGIRADIDLTENTPGFKYAQAEMLGIPLRIEIGPKDIENNNAIIVKRKFEGEDRKVVVKLDAITKEVAAKLNEVGKTMLKQNAQHLNRSIEVATNMDELGKAVNNGKFALAKWCGSTKCETLPKEKFAATTRSMPSEKCKLTKNASKKCTMCGAAANVSVVYAKSY